MVIEAGTKVIISRDEVAEKFGRDSCVGEEVEIVTFIPKDTTITIKNYDLEFESYVNKDVYLVNAQRSRTETHYGVPAPVKMSVIKGGVQYSGDDIFTAKELGVLEEVSEEVREDELKEIEVKE